MAKKAYHTEVNGGAAMLLASRDESFEDDLNFDAPTGKVEHIPTLIIKKSDADILKDFITKNPDQYESVHMYIKFENVRFTINQL